MHAQGQREEKKVKVEKYYRPKFEVFVRMPTFIFDTDNLIKAEVSSAYLYEKQAKGTIQVRWYAKKVRVLNNRWNREEMTGCSLRLTD